jgi:FkbM family methyltransferase
MNPMIQKYKNFILNSLRKSFRYFPFESIICYFSQDKSIESFIGKIIPDNKLYPENTIRRVKRNKINYVLDISDYQNWLIYFGLNNDKPEGLYELVKKKSIIIDVGGNIGQTAMNFAKIAGEHSIIFTFEPDELNYSNLIENLGQNNFKNIRHFNLGLGSIKEELPLKINSPSNRGGNRIDKKNTMGSSLIKIERLDHILEKEQINNVDLIKIDVEGFELEVLKGSKKTIERYMPSLYIEVDDNNLCQQGTNAKELINYVSAFGYNCIHSKSKEIVTPSDTNLKDCHFDIICSSNR